MNIELAGASAVMQGAGKVGGTLARMLHELGCKVIAIGDSGGGVMATGGLVPEAVLAHKRATGSITGYQGGMPINNADLLELPCDILIPAALVSQITQNNAPRIMAKVVLEAANSPTTTKGHSILVSRGITVIPDILANAGGVTVSSFEWVQDLQSFFWDEDEVNAKLEGVMVASFDGVWRESIERKVDLRTAAHMRAISRVVEGLKIRGVYP